jgi:cytoskeletal protein RodZ
MAGPERSFAPDSFAPMAAMKKQPGSAPMNLQQQRLRAGLSLEQIADQTKISIRFLRAIEAEEFEQLPGGIFGTSYIRQYAEAIGADAQKLLALHRARAGSSEPDREEFDPGRPKRSVFWWVRGLGVKSR